MILEGIVTSRNLAGELNVAPMGPVVDESLSTLLLRPFQSSQTYRNLKEHPEGVFHVVDDVLLLARAAIGRLQEQPPTFTASEVNGRVLQDCCRWFEFRVEELDDSQERTNIRCRVVHADRVRDFFGLNRAKHAVVEAAILATRVHILPADELRQQFESLRAPVAKTAGPREREAFSLLGDYIREASDSASGEPASVSVSTGARLHFGLLAHRSTSGRDAGGAGIMIDSPGWSLSASRSDADSIDVSTGAGEEAPETQQRVQSVLDRIRQSEERFHQPVSLKIESAVPAHAGLGSGTQLALAVTSLLDRLHGSGQLSISERARISGRGLRSAIGTWGFEQGGFLVDGGKTQQDELAPLVSRIEFPEDWRFVLITPTNRAGLSGDDEQRAFVNLSPTPTETTSELCRIVVTELLPSICKRMFEDTRQALCDYGRIVGGYFAPVQGGAFADPLMPRLDESLRSTGFGGLVQSSWGPTTVVLCESDQMARETLCFIQKQARPDESSLRVTVTRPLNRGAVFSHTEGG